MHAGWVHQPHHGSRRAEFHRGTGGPNGNRHQPAIGRAVEQRSTVSAPSRIAATPARHQTPSASIGETLHVHIFPSGFVRGERQPPPIRRELWVELGERGCQQRRCSARSSHREQPDVVRSVSVACGVGQPLSVSRPVAWECASTGLPEILHLASGFPSTSSITR